MEQRLNALALEKETYVRLTVCLANMLRLGRTAKIVDGQVAVDLADYAEVPSSWQVGLDQKSVKPEGAAEDAKGEDVVVVVVTAKVAPPVLVAPKANGASKILVP